MMKKVPHKEKNVAKKPPYGEKVAKGPPHRAKKIGGFSRGGGDRLLLPPPPAAPMVAMFLIEPIILHWSQNPGISIVLPFQIASSVDADWADHKEI